MTATNDKYLRRLTELLAEDDPDPDVTMGVAIMWLLTLPENVERLRKAIYEPSPMWDYIRRQREKEEDHIYKWTSMNPLR